MVRTKIAFLYSEVAGYFLACANQLAAHADVLIVRWPVNREAPFELAVDKDIQMIEKSDYTPLELFETVRDFTPDIVVCSGWMDKQYLELVKQIDSSVIKVLSLDNHWVGNWRQQLARVVSPIYLKRIFTHAWVPGVKQELFAKKLGFGKQCITGFYCADSTLFDQKYKATIEGKTASFPKRFLYVARYVKHKGIFEMWQAFTELQNEIPNDWELWCLGTGEEWENRVEHEKIRHFGFIQPKDLDEFIQKTGVYILPSMFEPWGVTVQEFAIAGYPLLLSDAIGSKERFLDQNGFEFKAGDVTSIKNAMKNIVELDEVSLKAMAFKSHQIGMSYTTNDWVKNILSLKK